MNEIESKIRARMISKMKERIIIIGKLRGRFGKRGGLTRARKNLLRQA